jgi:hypothetical protein
VNDALARKYWPDERAVGKRLEFSRGSGNWYQVVGIVGNVKARGLDAIEKPELYVPVLQPLFADPRMPAMDVVIRTSSDPLGMVPALRHDVLAIDPDQPIADIRRWTSGSARRCRRGGSTRSCSDRSPRSRWFSQASDLRPRILGDPADARDRRVALGAQRRDVLRCSSAAWRLLRGQAASWRRSR